MMRTGLRRLILSSVLATAVLASLGTADALAASTAKTGAATNVTSTGATLTGTVDATDADTAYTFVYGPTTSYGSHTTTTVAKLGTSTVSATVTGLKAGTTYHYELAAADGGTDPAAFSPGGDMTFTTAKAGSSSSTGSKSGTGSSSRSYGRASIAFGSKGSVAVAKIHCAGSSKVRCAGRVGLSAKVGKKTIAGGSHGFSVRGGKTATVTIHFTPALAALTARHAVKGTLTASFSTHQKKAKKSVTLR